MSQRCRSSSQSESSRHGLIISVLSRSCCRIRLLSHALRSFLIDLVPAISISTALVLSSREWSQVPFLVLARRLYVRAVGLGMQVPPTPSKPPKPQTRNPKRNPRLQSQNEKLNTVPAALWRPQNAKRLTANTKPSSLLCV